MFLTVMELYTFGSELKINQSVHWQENFTIEKMILAGEGAYSASKHSVLGGQSVMPSLLGSQCSVLSAPVEEECEL